MSEERLNELFSMINEGYPSIQEQEIRDYITNLQEENKRLKEKLNCKEIYSTYMPENLEFVILTKRDYERIELDYKSRIDKAIKYMEQYTDKLKTFRIPKIDFNYSDLLNILGGDKE